METRLAPIHPGEVLLEDFMKPLSLSQYQLAKDLGVTPIRISQIVRGQRSITADTALRLGRYFGTRTGTISSVSSVLVIMPPMMAIDIAWRNSPPALSPNTNGTIARINESDVIRIGRRRIGPAFIIA
ncbi:MAG: HigA family addiction module antidote protein [Anaerolineales bacterium]|nr:HigA family addiction module antidote protein [Anaerolineales bacterium]